MNIHNEESNELKNEHVVDLLVLDVNYSVSPNGVIQHDLVTLPSIHPDAYNHSHAFSQLPDVKIGDIYQVIILPDINLITNMVLVKRDPNENKTVLVWNLQHCPICNTPLPAPILNTKHCNHNMCPSRQRMLIHGFLHTAVGQLSYSESQAIDMLIPSSVGKVEDLFKITKNDIINTGVKCNADDLLNKIRNTRHVSISSYLLSLGSIIEVDQIAQDLEKLDNSYKNIYDLVNTLKIGSADISPEFQSWIYFQFLVPSNMETITNLNNLGVNI